MASFNKVILMGNLTRDPDVRATGQSGMRVARLGGNVVAQDRLGRRGFARPLAKRDSGVYVKVRFELDPQKVGELVNRYRLVEEVFRVQILAVNARREAKIASERQARADRQAKREAAQAAAIAAKVEA